MTNRKRARTAAEDAAYQDGWNAAVEAICEYLDRDGGTPRNLSREVRREFLSTKRGERP